MKTQLYIKYLFICGGIIIFLALFLKAKEEKGTIILATTTSVDATGLLDIIADKFFSDTKIKLKWVAVGTAQALRLASDGNADAVIVHAKRLEEEFVREGFGIKRCVFARNSFLLVGPEEDPAFVEGAKGIKDALSRIKFSSAVFVSRGDHSGTHETELELWQSAGGKPLRNYIETGQGMAQTLRVAMERGGYTISDSATFYGIKGLDGLRAFNLFSKELENVYAVIAVNPSKVPSVNYKEAVEFINWITHPKKGQKIIGEFKKNGVSLFEPIANKGCELR